MTAYQSSSSEVGDNFVLTRYLSSTEIPAAENSFIMSEYSVPDLETPNPKKSTLKLSKSTSTTSEHQTGRFANVPRTQSPSSAKSGQSTSSVTYNSWMYCSGWKQEAYSNPMSHQLNPKQYSTSWRTRKKGDRPFHRTQVTCLINVYVCQ